MHVKAGVEHRAVKFGRLSSKLSCPMMLTVRLQDTESQVEAQIQKRKYKRKMEKDSD